VPPRRRFPAASRASPIQICTHTERERGWGEGFFCEEDAADLRIYSIAVVISGIWWCRRCTELGLGKMETRTSAAGMGWDPYFPGQYMLLDWFVFHSHGSFGDPFLDLINHNSNLTTRLKMEWIFFRSTNSAQNQTDYLIIEHV
jgi:hypothetical protein